MPKSRRTKQQSRKRKNSRKNDRRKRGGFWGNSEPTMTATERQFIDNWKSQNSGASPDNQSDVDNFAHAFKMQMYKFPKGYHFKYAFGTQPSSYTNEDGFMEPIKN